MLAPCPTPLLPALLLLTSITAVTCRAADPPAGGTPGQTAGRRRRADDDSLSSVENQVQQQTATILQLQARLAALDNSLKASLAALDNSLKASLAAQDNSLKARLTALENSLPASFDKVGFSVRFNRDDGHGLAFSPNSILNFDHVVTSSPSQAYDPHTGIFTAPVSGLYAFFVRFMSINTFGHTYLGLTKDGIVLDSAFANGGDDYDMGSLLMAVQVTAGQKVWVAMNYGKAVRGGQLTTFTGFLLQAD